MDYELAAELSSTLEKINTLHNLILQSDSYLDEFLLAIDMVDQAISLLHDFSRNAVDPSTNVALEIGDAFREVHNFATKLYHERLMFPKNRVGRPKYLIPKESLEELRGLGLSWVKISRMFGVSRWTIERRAREFGILNAPRFSLISDDEMDTIVRDYITRHGSSTGEPLMSGYFRSLGYTIQRWRVRSCLNRVDPQNTCKRWGVLMQRRSYYVPWCNSLWHIDGHHSLIRWKFVIHGCVDGKSRRVMYLHCSTNNLASTNLSLFQNAIQENMGLCPSRVRVDYGVENVLICDEMVRMRGEGRGSFIAGSSTHNQRIERLWRDVFRCVASVFYYTFYAMEHSGILDVENDVELFALHHVFLRRINTSLAEFKNMFNNHRLSTENNMTPNQIWNVDMLDLSNPLAQGLVDETPHNVDYYGEDRQGPSTGPDLNNVVVTPVTFPHSEEISAAVEEHIKNLNFDSSNCGIDEYEDVLSFIRTTLDTLER